MSSNASKLVSLRTKEFVLMCVQETKNGNDLYFSSSIAKKRRTYWRTLRGCNSLTKQELVNPALSLNILLILYTLYSLLQGFLVLFLRCIFRSFLHLLTRLVAIIVFSVGHVCFTQIPFNFFFFFIFNFFRRCFVFWYARRQVSHEDYHNKCQIEKRSKGN
jgi:hypothetical protein